MVQPLLINSRIGGEWTHEKRPDIEVRPFLQIFTLEAKSGVETIYASL